MSAELLASQLIWQRNQLSGVQSWRMAGLSPEGEQCCSTRMPQLTGPPLVDLLGSLDPTDPIDVDQIKGVRVSKKPAPLFLSQCHRERSSFQKKIATLLLPSPLHLHPQLGAAQG